MRQIDYLRRIRAWMAVFMAGLIVSGITAFPLQTELEGLLRILHAEPVKPMATSTGLLPWIERVSEVDPENWTKKEGLFDRNGA